MDKIKLLLGASLLLFVSGQISAVPFLLTDLGSPAGSTDSVEVALE